MRTRDMAWAWRRDLQAFHVIPEEWEEYLNLLIKVYKALHPDRVRDSIFGSTAGPSSGGDPMDVDAADKKKSGNNNGNKKSKGKQVNSASKGDKFCAIHNSHGHNTADCHMNMLNKNKPTEPKPGPSTTLKKKEDKKERKG